MKLINFLRAKLLFSDKDQQDVVFSSLLLFTATAVSTFFLKNFNIFLVLFIILPAQFFITKMFAGPIKIENSFIVDINSGKKVKQSFWYLLIPIVFVILTLVSMNLDDIIDTEFSNSNVAIILFFLLPFISIQTFFLLKKLPLSFAYFFIYLEIYKFIQANKCNYFQNEAIDSARKMQINLDNHDMFDGPQSLTRRRSYE